MHFECSVLSRIEGRSRRLKIAWLEHFLGAPLGNLEQHHVYSSVGNRPVKRERDEPIKTLIFNKKKNIYSLCITVCVPYPLIVAVRVVPWCTELGLSIS